MFDQNLIVGLVVLAVVVMGIYAYAPRIRAMLPGFGAEGFQSGSSSGSKVKAANGKAFGTDSAPIQGKQDRAAASVKTVETFAAHEAGPAPAAAGKDAKKPAATTATESFADYASISETLGPVPMAGAKKPQGCYPREQLSPDQLLPADMNSQWAAVNPTATGPLEGKNFLSAGALIGVNTIGQSLRNSNLQLRAEPPNPQTQVGPWLQSTNEPDLMRRPLDG
jgi:hypothetical protein